MLTDVGPASAATLEGASLTWPWAVPFVGILSSIAIGPIAFRKVWHDHYGKITLGWAAVTLGCIGIFYSAPTAVEAFVKSMLSDYLSFILLLFALYIVAGGVLLTGRLHASPWSNAGMLALGTVAAKRNRHDRRRHDFDSTRDSSQ